MESITRITIVIPPWAINWTPPCSIISDYPYILRLSFSLQSDHLTGYLTELYSMERQRTEADNESGKAIASNTSIVIPCLATDSVGRCKDRFDPALVRRSGPPTPRPFAPSDRTAVPVERF